MLIASKESVLNTHRVISDTKYPLTRTAGHPQLKSCFWDSLHPKTFTLFYYLSYLWKTYRQLLQPLLPCHTVFQSDDDRWEVVIRITFSNSWTQDYGHYGRKKKVSSHQLDSYMLLFSLTFLYQSINTCNLDDEIFWVRATTCCLINNLHMGFPSM